MRPGSSQGKNGRESPVLPGRPSGVQEAGTIMLRRQVNNRLPDVVRDAVNLMKSHMLRRVEWRLEGASSLRACYSENKCICSRAFTAAGLTGLQLVFYPSGVT